jgi:hypothetical protein
MQMTDVFPMVSGLSSGCSMKIVFSTPDARHEQLIHFLEPDLYHMNYQTDLTDYPTETSLSKEQIFKHFNHQSAKLEYMELYDLNSRKVTYFKGFV